MDFTKALSLSLGKIPDPVITSYQLGLIIHDLFKNKTYEGKPLSQIQKEYASNIAERDD